MRWWRELRNPALKCERIGHRMGVEYRRGYVRPDDYYYVCAEVDQVRPACTRCHESLGEWKQTTLQQFTGYSWPSDQAREFKRDGEYWTTHYWSAAHD